MKAERLGQFVTTRLSDKEWRQLSLHATKDKRSLSFFVRRILSDWLRSHQEKRK
jgi:hypothetical protein